MLCIYYITLRFGVFGFWFFLFGQGKSDPFFCFLSRKWQTLILEIYGPQLENPFKVLSFFFLQTTFTIKETLCWYFSQSWKHNSFHPSRLAPFPCLRRVPDTRMRFASTDPVRMPRRLEKPRHSSWGPVASSSALGEFMPREPRPPPPPIRLKLPDGPRRVLGGAVLPRASTPPALPPAGLWGCWSPADVRWCVSRHSVCRVQKHKTALEHPLR